VKVSGRKAIAPKTPVAPKGTGVASLKTALVKAAPSHTKSVPRASVPPKVGTPVKAAVSKSAVTVTTSKAGVLRISTGTKRLSAASSQVPKGKHVRVDVAPSTAFAPTHKVVM
jgi:hypothetical protein